MMKTSSERSVWKSVLRNSAPRTGTSPRPGRALILLVTLFLIKPPMAKLWPSNSCTVVVARRVVNEGRMAVVEMPVAVMPMPSLFRSDTSGDTFRLMRPPSSTVGVNLTATPNSFSSSVIVGVPPLLVWLTGMKILPPARKLASWPLMAMMFGSASTLIRPSRFCASRLKKLFLLAPLKPLGLLLNRLDSSEYDQLPMVLLMPRLAPSWSTRVFDTSATLTSSITCCGAAMDIRLITRGEGAGPPEGSAAPPAAGAGAAPAPAAAAVPVAGREPRWA